MTFLLGLYLGISLGFVLGLFWYAMVRHA